MFAKHCLVASTKSYSNMCAIDVNEPMFAIANRTPQVRHSMFALVILLQFKVLSMANSISTTPFVPTIVCVRACCVPAIHRLRRLHFTKKQVPRTHRVHG